MVVDLAAEFVLEFFYQGSELLFVLRREVVCLEDLRVPLTFIVAFVWCDIGLMHSCHARLFLKQMYHLFFFVCAGANDRLCSIDNIFVNATLIESIILAESAYI